MASAILHGDPESGGIMKRAIKGKAAEFKEAVERGGD
jgi:hypothetical protein